MTYSQKSLTVGLLSGMFHTVYFETVYLVKDFRICFFLKTGNLQFSEFFIFLKFSQVLD